MNAFANMTMSPSGVADARHSIAAVISLLTLTQHTEIVHVVSMTPSASASAGL